LSAATTPTSSGEALFFPVRLVQCSSHVVFPSFSPSGAPHGCPRLSCPKFALISFATLSFPPPVIYDFEFCVGDPRKSVFHFEVITPPPSFPPGPLSSQRSRSDFSFFAEEDDFRTMWLGDGSRRFVSLPFFSGALAWPSRGFWRRWECLSCLYDPPFVDSLLFRIEPPRCNGLFSPSTHKTYAYTFRQ